MTTDAATVRERRILLIRHSQAGDPLQFYRETGQPDHLRPLTAKGVLQNQEAALGLRRLDVRVDSLWSSPFLRAEQTAAGIADVLGVTWQSLTDLTPPWRPESLSRWLESKVLPRQVVALVGHEPDLSGLLDYWLFGRFAFGALEMKKGSMALLRCSESFSPGTIQLLWKLPQDVLRRVPCPD